MAQDWAFLLREHGRLVLHQRQLSVFPSSIPFFSLRKLAYFPITGNAGINQVVRVIEEQSQSSWSDDWEFVSYYNWTGTPGALSPVVPNSGNGEPKLANGLVASSHRPSDDLCVFGKPSRE